MLSACGPNGFRRIGLIFLTVTADHLHLYTMSIIRCESVTSTYNYNVRYDGVGAPPKQSASLGHCSQLAVFSLISSEKCKDSLSFEETKYYEEVSVNS